MDVVAGPVDGRCLPRAAGAHGNQEEGACHSKADPRGHLVPIEQPPPHAKEQRGPGLASSRASVSLGLSRPQPSARCQYRGVPRVAFSSSPAVHQHLPWPHSAVWVGGCPPPARVLRPVPLIGGLAEAGSPGTAPGKRNLAWHFRRLGSGHCPPGHLYRLFPSTPSERNGSLHKGRSPSTPSFSLPEWYLRFADSPLPRGRVLLGADTRARPSLAFVRSAAAQPFRHLSLTATPPLASLPSLEHAMLVAPCSLPPTEPLLCHLLCLEVLP